MPEKASEIQELIAELQRFRDERNWAQFHNSKDLALAISIEASELNELFLWKQADDVDLVRLEEELADVFAFSLLLAAKHGLDVRDIVLKKMKHNSRKYPVDKARDTAAKYDRL